MEDYSQKRTLFVSPFSVETSEEDLQKYFARYGEVESVRISRDKRTKRSRRFGFVTFQQQEHAVTVVESTPHIFQDKEMFCKIAESKKENKKKTKAEAAKETKAVKKAEAALKASQETSSSDDSSSEEDTEENVVSSTRKRKAGALSEVAEKKRKVSSQRQVSEVWIGGLSRTTSEQRLQDAAKNLVGNHVVSVRLVRDTKGKRQSRGFGFLGVDSETAVQQLLDVSQTSKFKVDGRAVTCKRAQTSIKKNTRTGKDTRLRIFVGGLHPNTQDADIRAYCEQYGEVVEVIMKQDPETGRSRGFCFVNFAEKAGLDACLSTDSHRMQIKGDSYKRNITVKKAMNQVQHFFADESEKPKGRAARGRGDREEEGRGRGRGRGKGRGGRY